MARKLNNFPCVCGHKQNYHNAQGSKKGSYWTACSIYDIENEINCCFCKKYESDNLRYLEWCVEKKGEAK